MTKRAFALSDRLRSFSFAFAGLRTMLRTQHNAWIHAAITAGVAVAGAGLGLALAEWRWLLVATALVWFAEAINTAFEHLCDVVSPQFNPSVKHAKDIAAGAVLIVAAAACALGLSVFVPRLLP